MRIRETLHFTVHPMPRDEASAFLHSVLPDRDIQKIMRFHPSYAIPFWQGDPTLKRMQEWAKQIKGTPPTSINREAVFSKGELEAAPLLDLSVNRAPRGEGGFESGTRYDMSDACSACGTGARQITPLYLLPSDLPDKGDLLGTLTGETLVSPRVAEALVSCLGVQNDLRQAANARTKSPLSWWQIDPERTLPRLAPETTGILYDADPPGCPVCGRDGHFGTVKAPFLPQYHADDLEVHAKDPPHFLATWERFGVSRLDEQSGQPSFLADPLIIVSQAVYRVFRELKVRGARFTPVTITE